MKASDDQEIAATRLVTYFDESLIMATRHKLSIAGKRAIEKWVGEIITKHGLEEPDEMMRRDAGAVRDLVHRRSRLDVLAEPVAGETEAAQQFVV